MSISHILNEIENETVVLPAIQRDFVWDQIKISSLFDSIMRGYPIGIVLLWETYNDIDYRKFQSDFHPETLYRFENNQQNRRLKLVLDGQQRLQSIYTALFGSYEGMNLYFNILSGRESDDFEEDKYDFEFYEPHEIDEINKETIQDIADSEDSYDDWDNTWYYYRVSNLLNMSHTSRLQLENDVSQKLQLPDEERLRIRVNLGRLTEAFTSDKHILKSSVIDENIGRDSQERKSESDILEAFVRINTKGTQLSRSDLIFSLIKLQWRESAWTLPEFIRQINRGNDFELDADFVIRSLFAVSNLGTRFNVDLLRNRSNVDKIRSNYDKCCKAIKSTIDFVKVNCWISSSKLIKTYHNMIPLVYYLFHTPKHLVPIDQVDNVRKTLYLFGFTSPFSRYADSRLWRFISDELGEKIAIKDFTFPLRDAVWWVNDWERIKKLDADMLRRNPRLALHLIQRGAADKVQYALNAPEIDHIFPRSILREKGFDESLINHFANFWILASGKNKNKSNRHPKDYFHKVSDSDLRRAMIDREMLDYRKYRTFIRERESKIIRRLKRELGLKKKDYDFELLWPEYS